MEGDDIGVKSDYRADKKSIGKFIPFEKSNVDGLKNDILTV